LPPLGGVASLVVSVADSVLVSMPSLVVGV
jgi:hypothetical protein